MIFKLKEGITLKDAAKRVNSKDYRERKKGEYIELHIRRRRLASTLAAWRKGELPESRTPKAPYSLMNQQLSAMNRYVATMEASILIEGIDMSDILEFPKETKNEGDTEQA